MATTQEFYRLRSRNVRFSTQMQTMSKGMYLTDQLIPEGYAKVMVNYDIDDTGSCIKTRKGRLLHTKFSYEVDNYIKYDLGKMHLTDYIYTYNEANDEINDIKDVLISFGTYGHVTDFLENYYVQIPESLNKPIYISGLELLMNDQFYKNYDNSWGLYCDKGSETFDRIDNTGLGAITARTIKNAYVFDKKVARDLGYPIYTVMNNEIYAFAWTRLEANIAPNDPARSRFLQIPNFSLCKIKVKKYSGRYPYEYHPEYINARGLNPTEVQAGGFNMLLNNPYQLNDEGGYNAPQILGALVYTDTSNYIPVFSPSIGKSHQLRIYYQYPTNTTLEYKIEMTNGEQYYRTYETIKDWTSFTAGAALWVSFTPMYAKTTLRISIRVQGQTNTESVTVLPTYYCDDPVLGRLEAKKFDLATCKGMISWYSCIGVYGVDGAPDTIFFSDVEDPGYFPYPNNAIQFDNEILAVHNYLDMLLVITTDSIYVVQIGDTIVQSAKRKVMTNVFIPEVDAMNAVILKDQIFFKTDTDFYVLKPNKYTSDATDLKNYTNSTAISNYTKFFTKETINILNRVFRPIVNAESKIHRDITRFTDFDVINIEGTVKNEEVHYVYTIVPKIAWHHLTTDLPNQDSDIVNQSGIDTFGNLNLHLIYNTMSRSYRLYLVGIGEDNVSYTDKRYRNKQSGAFYEVIPYNLSNRSRILIVKEDLQERNDNIIDDDWQLTPYYNNYNYFDTGNIAIDDTYNKRYRELQMNVLNRTQSKIRFYTDVKVDGKLNVTSTRYKMEHITDPEDAEYGLVYIIPEEVDFYKTMMVAYGDTTLEAEEDLEELNSYWEIDMSKFPDLDIATIKLKLWGKGRRSSFQCLCTDLKNYELSSLTWVYRIMNVR